MNVEQLRSRFQNSGTILVIGDMILDRYVRGSVARISPEAPVPVLSQEAVTYYLGGAGNVFSNLKSLGANAKLVSVVGADPEADNVRARVLPSEACLITSWGHRPTTRKTRFMAGTHQLLRLDREETADMNHEADEIILAIDRMWKKDTSAVILSDYGKGMLTYKVTDHVIAKAKEAGVPVIVDPKKLWSKYQEADWLVPNVSELNRLCRRNVKAHEDVTIQHAADWLMKTARIRKGVVVKRGEHGATLVSRTGSSTVIQTSVPVVSVSGAGDTFVAVFALCLAADYDPEDAMYIANGAGRLVVQKHETSTLVPNELAYEIEGIGLNADKITDVGPSFSALAREEIGRIGFTNGCFDGLHEGHLHLIKEAAKKCDHLTVAVNSNASIEKLKGRPPKNSLRKRMHDLAALKEVNWVVGFDTEPQLAELVRTTRPDVLFKGADYEGKPVVGDDYAPVELIPLLKGYGTSAPK